MTRLRGVLISTAALPDRQFAHFYCSAAVSADSTEVYVVPREQFPTWIYAAFHDRLKEVTLYENRA